ncbi:Fic family protein [Alloscardovia venturai]|uniref:Fic family protein n=1 Tax=Alloscardovia venturai TaxID=1769421 RepID=A0ABW2Y5T6_9BIFI
MRLSCLDYDQEQLEALVNNVIKYHDYVIQLQGLDIERLDSNAKIESAIYVCFISHYGVPIEATHDYDDVFDQISDFAYHLATDHPFSDANKRTTVLTVIALLHRCGIDLTFKDSDTLTDSALYHWVKNLVEKEKTYKELAGVLRDNAVPRVTQ